MKRRKAVTRKREEQRTRAGFAEIATNADADRADIAERLLKIYTQWPALLIPTSETRPEQPAVITPESRAARSTASLLRQIAAGISEINHRLAEIESAQGIRHTPRVHRGDIDALQN